ncbi:HD domain-containing protein [Bacillus weihaiensis]|uniref:HD domain-containing protein n=1 Tax=Bacillus weihaiensis TaxID=1547283 RepID=UPI002352F43E|nr:HD domain-containing protein [Bacillus weihaiensis]
MDKRRIIYETEKLVFSKLEEEGSGHDWWHIERVRKLSLVIAKEEGADIFVVELAALLHDLIDDKLPDQMRLTSAEVKEFLRRYSIDSSIIEKVDLIIQTISFRKKIPSDQLSLEAKVVQDADRLDAIGAIGIARTFAFAGSRGNVIYDPISVKRTDAIWHFYEKLLLLKDKMNTRAGKKLAKERHDFLESFLTQFYAEWPSE